MHVSLLEHLWLLWLLLLLRTVCKFSIREQCCVRILQAEHLQPRLFCRLSCHKTYLFSYSSDSSWPPAPAWTVGILSKELPPGATQCKQELLCLLFGQKVLWCSTEQYFTLCEDPQGRCKITSTAQCKECPGNPPLGNHPFCLSVFSWRRTLIILFCLY